MTIDPVTATLVDPLRQAATALCTAISIAREAHRDTAVGYLIAALSLTHSAAATAHVHGRIAPPDVQPN